MALLAFIADHTRSPGDPKIIKTGPSARPVSDETARALGWFSIVLGIAELTSPHILTRMLGMEGKEGLIRAFGAREIAAGMTSLSTERATGLWSRLGGDIIDIAVLLSAYRDGNSKKHNVGVALAAMAAITLIDLGSAMATTITHKRGSAESRDYSDRSGFPQGVEAAKGAVPNPGRPTKADGNGAGREAGH